MAQFHALLLTDVVDSTQLAQQIGDDRMAEVWAAHDRVARELLPRWRGREIDKTDGMLLLFDSAADALAFAQAYHAGLAAMEPPLRARAGLHVGPVILRSNAPDDVARGAKPLEVDGLAKPMTARVMAIAQGGQTLVTEPARAALASDAAGVGDWRLLTVGHWQVKGADDPLELFDVVAPGRRPVVPPDGDKAFRVVRGGDWWLPVREIPHNLPHQPSSFVGRDSELDELERLLERSRLLTLLGMGGLGKTRLSLELAAQGLHRFPDGAWFIDLAPLREGELVAREAAQALGVVEQPGQPLLDSLRAHLKPLRCLLILDNCEHLIASAAALAAALLRAAPHLRIVATSREALHVPGEQAWPVMPLLRSTAVQLFEQRARAHQPAFTLDDEATAGAVGELVTRLEGIPLALELAAARLRSLSVAEINLRLKYRYKILTGGARTAQQRQQTLRALVDWSYGLLNQLEQRLFDRLAVFIGGFDLEAAEQVCGDTDEQGDDNVPLPRDAVLDLIDSLVEKSLVMVDAQAGASRYRMLETLREYAAEKLAASGEGAALATRHGAHMLALCRAASEGQYGPEHTRWVERVEAEIDNLRAAMAHALVSTDDADALVAAKLCVAMMGFWIQRGRATEGRAAVRAALALPAVQASDMATAHALYVGAALATVQGDNPQALQMLETCLVLRRRLGNAVHIAATLSTLSLARLQSGDAPAARASEDEALALFRAAKHRRGEAIGRLHLGAIDAYEQQGAAAREHLQAALAIAREIAVDELAGECECKLGDLATEAQDVPAAAAHYARAVALCVAASDAQGEATARWRAARLDLRQGRLDAARGPLAEAARQFQRFSMQAELLGALEDGSVLKLLDGDAASACRVAAAAAATRAALALRRTPAEEREWERHLAALREAAPSFGAEWRDASGWTIDQALAAAGA